MSLLDLLSDARDENQADGKFYGVAVGIVEDIDDPLQLGRVKVNFPWLAANGEDAVTIKGDQNRAHSYWARIATLMAGKDRGTYFIPDNKDEVLVAFEHGDLDRPIVLGALWNKEDKPPVTMDKDGKNDIRAIHSRLGHKIELNDSKDKPSITISDKGGNNRIVMDLKKNDMEIHMEGSIKIVAKKDIELEAGGKINLSAEKDLTAKTKANLKIDAGAKADIVAKAPMTLKSSATLTANGQAQAELKGGMVSVSGSSMTEVKGAVVKIN